MAWSDVQIFERLAERSAAYNGGPVPLDGDFFQPALVPMDEWGPIFRRLLQYQKQGVVKIDMNDDGKTTYEFTGETEGLPNDLAAIVDNRYKPE